MQAKKEREIKIKNHSNLPRVTIYKITACFCLRRRQRKYKVNLFSNLFFDSALFQAEVQCHSSSKFCYFILNNATKKSKVLLKVRRSVELCKCRLNDVIFLASLQWNNRCIAICQWNTPLFSANNPCLQPVMQCYVSLRFARNVELSSTFRNVAKHVGALQVVKLKVWKLMTSFLQLSVLSSCISSCPKNSNETPEHFIASQFENIITRYKKSAIILYFLQIANHWGVASHGKS